MRFSPTYAARTLAYCEAALADDTSEDRRAALEAKADVMRTWLDGHICCRRCGRPLTDPDSVARRLGPDCAQRVSS